MIVTQWGRFVILIIFVCALGLALHSNIKGLSKYLSSKQVMNPDLSSLCKASDEGGSALLGSLLYKFFDHQIIFYMPSPENNELAGKFLWQSNLGDIGTIKGGSYSGKLLNSFSYPITALDKEYDWRLSKDEFEFLMNKRVFIEKCMRYNILLVGTGRTEESRNEIALFVYGRKDYGTFVVIAPFNWRSSYNHDASSF